LPTARDAHDPYEALRYPGYLLYLLVTQASHLANQVAYIAIGWTLYDRTASAWPLAFVGLAMYLPIFSFSLPAGLLADHPRRKAFLAYAVAGQFLAFLGLAWAVHVQAPLAVWYGLVFLSATASAVRTPLAVSFYPTLIPMEAVANSVTWNSSNFQVSAIAGPVLGGALLHWLGPAQAFAVAAAGPALYLLGLPFLKPLRQAASANAAETLRARILGGWHYLQKESVIRWALTLDLFAVLFGGADAIMPIFAKDILHVGPLGLGWLKAAGFAGALCMSLWVAHRPLRHAGRSMLLAVGAFGLCMVTFSLSHSYLLSFAALFTAGAMDAISVVVRQTMVQVRTPEHLRGRVQAVNFLFIGSSNELGEFESGMTAAWFGPVGSVLYGGLATLGVVAWVAMASPELRRLARLDKAEPSPATEQDGRSAFNKEAL
jgi:MFS family permease